MKAEHILVKLLDFKDYNKIHKTSRQKEQIIFAKSYFYRINND